MFFFIKCVKQLHQNASANYDGSNFLALFEQTGNLFSGINQQILLLLLIF